MDETSGRKLTEVSERISKAIEAKRTGLIREVGLLRREEKMDDLDINLLGLRVDTDVLESPMSEKECDTPTVEKSSKQ